MRLTLRTLLAYLDDTLEPEDAASLRAKIEESTFATSLVARIRAAMKERDLNASAPDAVGPLENANVISEYLDSTLSGEQVAEIERYCLEHDTSLAEAAACHQILTVVLGQPARVSESLRQRIYGLPDSDALRQAEAAPAEGGGEAGGARGTPTRFASIEIPPAAADESDASPTHAADGSPGPVTAQVAGAHPVADAATLPMDRAAVQAGAAAQADAAGSDPARATAERDSSSGGVPPLGRDDSGVADAPTRLREEPGVVSGRSEAEEVVGLTREALRRSDGYGGLVRPSRVAPWLVSLAVVAALAFALAQTFKPLFEDPPGTVGDDSIASLPPSQPEDVPGGASSGVDGSDGQPGEAADPLAPPLPPGGTADPSGPSGDPSVDPAAESNDVPPRAPTMPGEPRVPGATAEMTTAPPDGSPSTPQSPDPTDLASVDGDGSEPDSLPTVVEVDPSPVPDQDDSEVSTSPAELPDEPSPSPDGSDPPETDTEESAEPEAAEPSIFDTEVIAQSVDADSLMLVRQGENWKQLQAAWPAKPAAGALAPAEATLIVPPLYRPVLVRPESLEWTLVGPTEVRFDHLDGGGVQTQLGSGRLLLASLVADVSTQLRLGPQRVTVTMPQEQTVLAVELVPRRPLGADPRSEQSRTAAYRVVVVQGSAEVQWQLAEPANADDDAVVMEEASLEAGQQWRGSGEKAGRISSVDRLPVWTEAPPSNEFVESAREGVLSYLQEDEPLEKSLREAMEFRRPEVAALAAETLLMIGRADVYFGTDGILSRSRQREYWTEHFQALRQQMDSGVQAAQDMHASVMRAELADGERLYKLLVGYSAEELAAGGDAELVDALGSPSMAVRVLAIENLKQISGDSRGYRAEQENATRRAAEIRPWESLLRRGEIRLSPPGQAEPPTQPGRPTETDQPSRPAE